MPKSAAFARIKADVLEIAACIPKGRVCTFQTVGQHLDVMPRHVAYILAQLDDASKMVYPWHRVVSADGSLGVPKRGPDGKTQAELLQAEGVPVNKNAVSPRLEHYVVSAEQLAHGVPRQRRSTAPGESARTPDGSPSQVKTSKTVDASGSSVPHLDDSSSTLKLQLLASLSSTDGLEAHASRVAGGTALFFRGKEFAHFHNDHEIDLRLTRSVIKSLGLSHPTRSQLHPTRSASSHWIEVRFHTSTEVQRVAELVKQAIAQL